MIEGRAVEIRNPSIFLLNIIFPWTWLSASTSNQTLQKRFSNYRVFGRPGKSFAARQPAASGGIAPALKWPLRRSQNPPPTKSALKIHHFKGSQKFRLPSAMKLFSCLVFGNLCHLYAQKLPHE